MEFIKVKKVNMIKEGSLKVPNGTKRISSPKEVFKILQMYLDGADREHLVCICLNTKNHVINIETISIGSLNASIVHPREVFKIAILSNSASIILGHNHPSGDPTPSREDINISERLKECGQILGIDVLDHVIIGEDSYISLKDKGLVF